MLTRTVSVRLAHMIKAYFSLQLCHPVPSAFLCVGQTGHFHKVHVSTNNKDKRQLPWLKRSDHCKMQDFGLIGCLFKKRKFCIHASINLCIVLCRVNILFAKTTILPKEMDYLSRLSFLPWLGCKPCVLKHVADWQQAQSENTERILPWSGPKLQQRQCAHRPVVGAVRTPTVSCCCCLITTQSWGCFPPKHASTRAALRSLFNPMVCFTRVNMTELVVMDPPPNSLEIPERTSQA